MTLEEAFAAATVDVPAGVVDDVFVIDAPNRKIIVPDSESVFGVETDKDVERKYFRCPRIVGDNIDLSQHKIYVVYVTAKDVKGTFFPDIVNGKYWCDDVTVDGDYITFSWKLSDNVMSKAGIIAFKILAVTTENGTEKTRWNTAPAYGTVLMTVPDGEGVEERYPDIITQLLERMDAVEGLSLKGLSAAGALADQVPTADGEGGWLWKHQKGSSGLSYINVVTEYGVDNTGEADVTDVINNIIQSVDHSKILYFPTGIYKITDTITLNQDVGIIGDTFLTRQHDIDFGGTKYVSGTVFMASGENFVGKAIIEASGWVPDYIAHITIVSDSCLITDPRLAAGADNMSTDGNMVDSFTKEIRYENVTGIHSRGWGARLEHIRVFGCSNIGFQLEMGDMIDNCMAQSCHIGYQIETDCTATDLRVNACDIGYYVRGTANTLSNLRADGCHEVGMRINQGANNISNCYFDFCNGALIHLYNSSSNNIRNVKGRPGALYAGFTPDNVPEEGFPYACGLLIEGNCFNNDIDINIGYGNLSDDNSVNTHNGPTFKVVCKSIDSDHRYQSMNRIHLSGSHFNQTWQNFGTPLPFDVFKQVLRLVGDVQVSGQLWYMGVEYGMEGLTSAYSGQKIFTDNDYPYSVDIWSGWFKPIRAGMIMHNTNNNVDFLSYGDSGDKMLNIQQVIGYNTRIGTLEENNKIEVGETTEETLECTDTFEDVTEIQMSFYGKTVLSAGKRYEIIINSYTGTNATQYSLFTFDSSWGGYYNGSISNIGTQKFSVKPSFDINNFAVKCIHENAQSGELTMSITVRKLPDEITLKEAVQGLDTGTPGKSAYQYAQEGGYTGSEEEFAQKLASEYPTDDHINSLIDTKLGVIENGTY